ncbi:MAG: LacI family DNA-binding transcriptional regulator [Micromonosporaceae bacterium]|nr:LacI family DNA-binding transcriptional regulator [Micromonosporaceae bacterium]
MTVTELPPRVRPLPPDAPTLADVAKLAGVSIATASRVLNNSARVSAGARQQVRSAATRLGYVRHRAAPSHPRQKIRSVAAMLYANCDRIFADPFFARLICGSTEELASHGVPMMLIAVNDERLPLVQQYVHSGHFDGVVVLADHGSHPLAESLPTYGIPMTLVGTPSTGVPVSFVDADNRAGARTAVEYLIRQGRRSIGTIAGPPNKPVGADRLAGYREALWSAGMTELPIAYGDWSQASGVHAMSRLLDQRPGLDAVFVASDVMATGALYVLQRAGRRVPDDVAVIGFDDLALAAHTRPRLTTVRQPIEQYGAVAARLLLDILDHGSTANGATLLPTSLVVRESA